MLDMQQAEALVAQLQKADERATSRSTRRCRWSWRARAARRERAFAGLPGDEAWFEDVASIGPGRRRPERDRALAEDAT